VTYACQSRFDRSAQRMVSYLEDSPGVVFVVRNAAVAHSPVSHNRVETRVMGHATAASWTLAGGHKAADLGVSAVLLLDRTLASVTHDEEGSTGNAGNGEHTDNDACGDASCACALGLLCSSGRGRYACSLTGGGDDDGLTCPIVSFPTSTQSIG
jgi:hypothetical protein